MTHLESDQILVNKSAKEVFNFLTDFNNFQRLMPEQVTDWKSTSDTCSFTIKGMATLGMKIAEKTPNTSIVIKRDGKAPFDFILFCNIEEVAGSEQCKVQLAFGADLNPMLKMMASTPLTNFLNLLTGKLRDL